MELQVDHFCLPKVLESQVKVEASLGKIFPVVVKNNLDLVNVNKKFGFLESLIATVSACSPDEIKQATGKLSDLIGDLSNRIDWNHKYAPENVLTLDSATFEKFVVIVKEQLNLYQRHKEEYPYILDLVSNAICNLKEFKSIKNSLLKLSSSVRLFSEQEVRNKIRLKKKQKNLFFLDSYSSNEIMGFWLSLPEDNNFLCRGSAKLGYFHKDSSNAISIFEKHGYNDIVYVIKNSFIHSMFINGNSDDARECEPYHGFCRVKMGRMALAIAKLNGFSMNAIAKTSENPTGFSLVAGKNTELFKQFGFKSPNDSHIVEATDGVAHANDSTLVMPSVGTRFDMFKFAPRAYPLHVFGDMKQSDHVKKILSWCEACPEIENRTLFDHYWLVVPGISMHTNSAFSDSNGFNIVINNKTNKANVFTDPQKATMFLDKLAVENNVVFPALIGEKDGKCYFITIWH